MAHLIEPIRNSNFPEAIAVLEKSHALIVQAVKSAQLSMTGDDSILGGQYKRLEIPLPYGEAQVGKSSEKFVEIINILATAERTISALVWLSNKYPNALVRECHPSTSDETTGSDIVLIARDNSVLVRCEVTDVVSSNAAQNGKEKKDLKNLGCATRVPDDGVARFIATSEEFAQALSSPKRKWSAMHYRYKRHDIGLSDNTMMLEIQAARPGL
jgi:hypothetical protein